jgi:prenyltransferase beta subunit
VFDGGFASLPQPPTHTAMTTTAITARRRVMSS